MLVYSSDYNAMKPEIKNRKIAENFQNIWRLKSTLLNNTCQGRSLKKLEALLVYHSHLSL